MAELFDRTRLVHISPDVKRIHGSVPLFTHSICYLLGISGYSIIMGVCISRREYCVSRRGYSLTGPKIILSSMFLYSNIRTPFP